MRYVPSLAYWVARGFTEWTALADGEGLDELELVTQRDGFGGGASDEVTS
jgi:hypothetical protein